MNYLDLEGKINLVDPRLFGNEAAEDEDPKRLNSYFVEKNDFSYFEDSTIPLAIIRARKGVGKSALLHRVAYGLASYESKPIVISLTGSDLIGQRPFISNSPNEFINEWQQRICYSINLHIGNLIGIALNDDTISLVENSELAGFKKRNLVSALLDRLKGKVGSLTFEKIPAPDSKAVLERYQDDNKEKDIWVFIDDIDATFRNTDKERIMISSFISACRAITRNVQGLKIRCSVRTDVWSSIRSFDEALDKAEQYITDLRWSRRETGAILAQRIRAYILEQESCVPEMTPERKKLIELGIVRPMKQDTSLKKSIENASDNNIINLTFTKRFAWSNSGAHHVIHVLSAGRPRWALQLCKMAAKEGKKISTGNSNIIKFGFIKQILENYGQFRVDDMLREHTHQCPEIENIVHSFARQGVRYQTDQLLSFIETAILNRIKITIDGVLVTNPLKIAHFLYRTNFFVGRDYTQNLPVFYKYEDKPHLLKTITNLDEGLTWEVAPSYRQALNLSGPGSNLDNLDN